MLKEGKKEFEADPVVNQTVVIDNGSGFIKAGFAGSDKPRLVCHAIVGTPKYCRVMAGGPEGDTFIGNRAMELRGLLKLKHPISNGVINDWADMELLWTSVYQEMKAQPEEHPALLTEPPLNPKQMREKMAETFFETFGVPTFFLTAQAVLALYASGRTSGVVLDSGDGATHVVPLFEGFAMPHAVKRADVAGRDVTSFLSFLLQRSSRVFKTSSEFETVRAIKEAACFVSVTENIANQQEMLPELFGDRGGKLNPSTGAKTDAANFAGMPSYAYTLPDGTTVNLQQERYRAPEILFNPGLLGKEDLGAHQLVHSSIQSCDMELRRDLFSQIVLSGGSTLLPGYVDRLLSELRKLASKETTIRIYAPAERHLSTYIGGSILGSLGTFKRMWITKQEYHEEGPSILHRRLF